MAWSGKLVGGLIGGMLGGPLGAGLGATVGHVLGDASRTLELQRLDWQHHGFGESGPGLVLTPVWTARRLLGTDVTVRVKAGDTVHRATVTPEDPDETCAAPRVFVPYASLGEAATSTDIFVRVRAAPGAEDEATFAVRLPNPVRRLGGSGPARAVMALVACARAGERAVTREDVRFIAESFEAGLPLDTEGRLWLKRWLRELLDAEYSRLTAEKVAVRLDPHLDPEGRARLVGWLWRGVAEAWPGEPQRAWVVELAEALGTTAAEADTPDARLEAWATLGVAPGTTGEALREAWLRLVRTWHPDRARTPEEVMMYNRRMAEVNAAYRSLNP